MPFGEYLLLMAGCYLLTAAIETAVLWVGLSHRHGPGTKLFAGLWLSACTYPVVWLILPEMFEERWAYLLVAETFAPVAEAVLFWWAFVRGRPWDGAARDIAAIVAANLASFAVGEAVWAMLASLGNGE